MVNLMKRLHRQEKGFTLVELMVVVVIIGVLVAIAVPIFGLVAENARETADDANRRILVGASAMFLSQHGNPDPALTGIGSPGVLDPYLDEWPTDPWDRSDPAFTYKVDISSGGAITVNLN